MKVGDLVRTKCFGPAGSVGEIGMLVRKDDAIINCWVVMFGSTMQVLAREGLEVINGSR